MCGRYRLSRQKQLVQEYFETVSDEPDWAPRYNIAPTQSVPVIRQNPNKPIRELSLLRWGLIPSWMKDSSGAAAMINARLETAGTKPAFRDALKSRRCLIPADGFMSGSGRGKRSSHTVLKLVRGVVCLRGNLGSLEKPEWQLGANLFDPDYNAEYRDLSRP